MWKLAKPIRAIVLFFVALRRSGLNDTDLYYVALRPLWVPDGDASWHNTVVASELEPQVLDQQQQLVIAQERLAEIIRISQQVHEQLEALQDHQLSGESRDCKVFLMFKACGSFSVSAWFHFHLYSY